MTRLLVQSAMLLMGIVLGGTLIWPIARRVGEARPNGLYYEPVNTLAGRRWTPVVPPAPRRSVRDTAAAWWAVTAPRDVDGPVRAALVGGSQPPPWMASDYIGRPPVVDLLALRRVRGGVPTVAEVDDEWWPAVAS